MLMGQDAEFHRQVLLGVRDYAGHAKQWLFHNAPPIQAVLRPLAQWNPHGIIAHLDDAKVARAILKLGKPVVDTACMIKGLKVPTVDVDHVAVAQLAADYLLARGYRHFGFFGSDLVLYPQLREASFRRTVEQAGFKVRACHIEYRPHLPHRTNWKSVYSQVQKWLKELGKPVAILADHDVAAHDLADMCLVLGLRVPDDVAILGVDNDELECQLAFPPLSSVAIPAERIGFEAARLLDRMISGKHVASGPLYLPPIRVVTRQSTSMFAVEEPIVTAALHYIRNHLAEPLKVSCIAAELTVRRRELEERFRTLLGRSVLDEIHRVRMDRAKELLASADLSVSTVAEQSGFSTSERMAKVFRKVAGLSPGEFRRQTRVHRPL
jgi:LacI family transcriptional regulator